MNLFETTIRVLGGLQSAHFLSGGDDLLALRARELGLRMMVTPPPPFSATPTVLSRQRGQGGATGEDLAAVVMSGKMHFSTCSMSAGCRNSATAYVQHHR